MLAALAVAVLLAAAAPAAEARPTGWNGIGAPILNYNSDLGMGLGGVGALVNHGDGTLQPYRTYFAAQLLFTTRGVHSHQLWLDALRLFDTPLRLQAFATYYEEPFANWFGAGQSSVEESSAGKRFHQYRLREMPAVRAALGIPLADRLVLRAGWRVKRVIADAYPGSLAELQPPRGLGTSWASEATLSFVWDGRDREVEPTRGVFAELFGRAALRELGSSWPYHGATLTLRGYRRVHPRLTLAGRLLADAIAGAPPFWELAQFGGTDRLQGLGSGHSVRGVRQARFVGKVKLVTNLEARGHVARFHLFGSPVDVGAVLFADGGRVFREFAADGPWPGLVFGLGGGLRLLWNETVILRVDAALPIGDRGYGAYVQINQVF